MMIKAGDTDVLVIAVSVLPSLQQSGLQQLRVSFGQRNNLRWIPVHELCLAIGLAKTRQILCSSMHSPDAMSYQPSVVKERSLHG